VTTWRPQTPAHWRVTTIGQEAETKLGRMLNGEARTGPDQVPYLRNENVRWGTFDLSDVNTMSIPPAKQGDYLLKPGDILVCEGGDIGRAAVWSGSVEPMYFQKALHRIRLGPGLDATFVRYWLEHLATSNRLLPYATGSTILHLPQQALRKLPLVLPPLVEQRVVVETIERMLSHLDAARGTAEASRRRLEPMRRSVLADVFRLRQSNGIELPDGWQAATIGEVAEVRLGRQRSPKDHLGEQMRPYLRAANVTWYRLRGDDVQQMNFTDEEMSVYALREGDLLAVEGGTPEDVGKCVLVTEPFVGHAFQNTLIRLRVRPGVDHRWLMYRLNAEGELGGYRSIARGAGNIQHLSVTRYRAHPLALPPLEEQQLQVERLESELSRMRHLTTTLTTALDRSVALRRSILKAAFEGRLTRAAQDAPSLDDLQEAIA
jgi:type I restriction enzyme, S subunit